MTQDDVRQVVETAISSVAAAYWSAPADIQSDLADIQTSLNSVLTQLNQGDLAARADQFEASAHAMTTALGSVGKLKNSVAKLEGMDSATTKALNDTLKLAMTTSFFKIPAPEF